MAHQVILSKLRLSVWDRKQQRSEPILDGRHDEVADFLDTSSATLGDYLKGLSIQLSGKPKARKEDLPHLEVSAILSDLSYAYEALPATDWLTWYEETVKPELKANSREDQVRVTYPAKGTPIRNQR